MRPPWSILLFTTLAGAGQGLVLALLGLELGAAAAWPAAALARLAAAAFVLLAAGLAASVFHLGHPTRGWRAASQWRTSWLSREVIVLPASMAAVALHALALAGVAAGYAAVPAVRPVLGLALGLSAGLMATLAVVLWLCTGMIYACLRMIEDWATPLTPLVFAASGLASGLVLAGAACTGELHRLAASLAGDLHSAQAAAHVAMLDEARDSLARLDAAALGATVAAAALQAAWCRRRAGLTPATTLQSALAIGHPRVRQMSMGFTGGGSFNTREFRHQAPEGVLQRVVAGMIGFGAVAPLAVFGSAAWRGAPYGLVDCAALAVVAIGQLGGVLCQRWLFFVWARHPQNLYYQRES